MSSGSEDTLKVCVRVHQVCVWNKLVPLVQPNKSHSALSVGSTVSSKSLGPVGMPRVIRTEVSHTGVPHTPMLP